MRERGKEEKKRQSDQRMETVELVCVSVWSGVAQKAVSEHGEKRTPQVWPWRMDGRDDDDNEDDHDDTG